MTVFWGGSIINKMIIWTIEWTVFILREHHPPAPRKAPVMTTWNQVYTPPSPFNRCRPHLIHEQLKQSCCSNKIPPPRLIACPERCVCVCCRLYLLWSAWLRSRWTYFRILKSPLIHKASSVLKRWNSSCFWLMHLRLTRTGWLRIYTDISSSSFSGMCISWV